LYQVKRRKKKRKRLGDAGDLMAAHCSTPGAHQALRHSSSGLFWVYSVVAVMLCCALMAPCLIAKEKKVTLKTVTGQVLDPSDNGIDGATVTLKDLQTGKTLAVYTRDGGHYQFSDLKLNHDYELQANHKGVTSDTRQVSSVDTRTRLVVNLVIPPPSS
jgi:hypothetical protein